MSSMAPPLQPVCDGLQLYEPDPSVLYSIELAARLSHVSRGLRRIQDLRAECGMNPVAIRMILDLIEELEMLRRDA